MHNHSIIFLFLVFRDIIVANKAFKPPFSPLICKTMTFDTQWCYVIGITRDLLLKTAFKVQLACVASVSSRIARKLVPLLPSPSPFIPFFALVPVFSTNLRGTTCYAG